MSNKALISVAVFAALLLLVVVTREDRVAVGVRSLELASLDKAAVQKIEVSGKQTFVLEKADGATGFTVSSPDKPEARFATDDSVVTQALDALAEVEGGSFVTGRAAKHAELEIDDEKGLSVTIHQAGKPKVALVFGRAAQGGNFVRLKGSDEVFVGKGSLAQKLSKDVSAWRKKKLLDAELKDLKSLLIEPAEGPSYTLEAREEVSGEPPAEGEPAPTKTTWAFASSVALPEGFRGDDELLRRVATSVAGFRAADFLDGEKSAAETGLSDKPALGRVVVTTADGKSVAIRIGTEDEKKRSYVQIEGEPQIYLLPGYSTKNAIKTLEQLRDLSVARFDVSTVEGLKLTSPEGAVEITKGEGGWSLTQPSTLPDGFEFDAGRVDALLASLSRLKAQERFGEPPAGHGTGAPTTKVTLSLAGGATKTLAFGSDVPGEEGGKKVYLQGAEEPNVYAIAQHQKARFDKPLELFKKLPPPPAPPQGMGGGGMIPGMENLPPDVRKKLEESLRQQGMPGR